ncbi:MAG: hypothetical protein ABI874_13640, partial [Chloroflexota bacterium]
MSNPTPAEPEPKTSSTIISVQQTTARVGDQAKIVGVEVGTVGGDVVIHFAEQAYEVRGLPNPFLGMQTFTYADHAKFGGRQQAIRETVAKLTVPDAPLSLLFVTGASGSGKSSFAQAGLLPALEHFYATLTLKWAVFRPSRQPVAAFGDALWRQLGLAALDPANLTPESFAQFLRDQTPARQVNVIVVDQFEEAFTQSEPQARDALFALLAALPPFAQARTHVIATMRADYLPELFAVPALFAIAKQGVELRVMSEAELSDAIQQPLRAAYPDGAKHFEPALVEHLARDAASEASYLPLLQVTLEEIWRKGSLTLGAYGNLTDAIKQRADKVLIFSDYESDDPHQARPPADQQTILDIFLDLVDPAPNDDARRDVRRRRAEDELTAQLPDRMRLADALIQARLLSVTIEA